MKGLIGILYFVFYIWVIYDILTSNKPGSSKFLWIVGVLIFQVVGPLVYIIFGRKQII
jgi:Phospholipase_D-nuclease N-terminal